MILNFNLILEKFLNYQLINNEDIKELMKKCPETHKKFNYEKAIFEHNYILFLEFSIIYHLILLVSF